MRAIFTSSGAPEVTCSRSPGPRLVGDIRRRRIILGLALQNTRSALEIDPIAGPIGSAETEYDTGKYVAQRGNGYATYSHRATPRLYSIPLFGLPSAAEISKEDRRAAEAEDADGACAGYSRVAR
jgi:hypothetical protein